MQIDLKLGLELSCEKSLMPDITTSASEKLLDVFNFIRICQRYALNWLRKHLLFDKVAFHKCNSNEHKSTFQLNHQPADQTVKTVLKFTQKIWKT